MLFSMLACGSLPVSRMRMDQLRASIERVSNAGAMTCAPRELALARAHYDFAHTELLRGDAKRALRHLALAEQNVGAAQVLTPDRGCKSTKSSANEVSAIASRSSLSRASQANAEADGGGHTALASFASFQGGAVKACDARDQTLTAYERIRAGSALTASQVTYAANDRHTTEARDRCAPTTVKQTSLTQ